MTNTTPPCAMARQGLRCARRRRSDLWFIYHLGKRLKQLYAGSTEPRDKAMRALTWDYPECGARAEPDAEAVLREINGYTVADRRQLSSFQQLKDDGSTACGGWMYCGIYPSDGHNWRARAPPMGRAGRKPSGLGVRMAGQSPHAL